MWNYRIIKKENDHGLYEVFYNDDGKITAHTDKPILVEESPEDLLNSLRLMLDDAQKSYYKVLEYGKIEFAPLYDEKDLSEAMTIEEFESELESIGFKEVGDTNSPPLSWTDPDVDVDKSDYIE